MDALTLETLQLTGTLIVGILAVWLVVLLNQARSRAERAYKSAANMMICSALIAMLPETVMVFTVDEHGVILVSKNRSVVGLPLYQVIGIGGKDKDSLDAAFKAAFDAPSTNQELEFNGGSHRLEVQIKPVDRILVVVVQDRSDYVHLQRQLVKSQRMEALGRLAAGIAHDINNYLTSVIGYAELTAYYSLSDREDDPVIRGALDDLKKIIQAGRAGARISNQLLAFGRSGASDDDENGYAELQSISLEDLAKRVIGLASVGREGVEVTLVVSPDRPTIRGRLSQLEQVALNLIVNAYEAMPGGGTLAVEVESTVIDSAGQDGIPVGQYARFSVSDTGPGIPKSEFKKIFDPFYTTKDDGTGLGLPTVQSIVKGHGGFILVRSKIGVGSVFSVYFPVDEGTDVSDVLPINVPESPVITEGQTALIVDDSPAVREVVCRTLRPLGVNVLEAGTSEEAIRLADGADQVSLAVVDIILPDTSGLETAVHVRLKHPDVYVLYISGYVDRQISDVVFKRNSGYLGKPFGFREILTALGLGHMAKHDQAGEK